MPLGTPDSGSSVPQPQSAQPVTASSPVAASPQPQPSPAPAPVAPAPAAAAAATPSPPLPNPLSDDDLGDGFFANTRRDVTEPEHVRSSYLDDSPSEDFSESDVLKRRRALTPEQEVRRARFVRLVAGVIGFGVAVFLVALVVTNVGGDEPPETATAPDPAAERVEAAAQPPAVPAPNPSQPSRRCRRSLRQRRWTPSPLRPASPPRRRRPNHPASPSPSLLRRRVLREHRLPVRRPPRASHPGPRHRRHSRLHHPRSLRRPAPSRPRRRFLLIDRAFAWGL